MMDLNPTQSESTDFIDLKLPKIEMFFLLGSAHIGGIAAAILFAMIITPVFVFLVHCIMENNQNVHDLYVGIFSLLIFVAWPFFAALNLMTFGQHNERRQAQTTLAQPQEVEHPRSGLGGEQRQIMVLGLVATPQPTEELDMYPNLIAVYFSSKEIRENWTKLAKDLGEDEFALASRTLTNFITYCDEARNKPPTYELIVPPS